MTISYTPIDGKRVYYVIFEPRRGSTNWWNIFTTKQYHHVWLLTESNGATMTIKPTPNGCQLDSWPCNVNQALSFLPKDVTAVLRYIVEYKSLSTISIYSILTCVSYTKYLLCVNGFGVLTPKRLYKRLVNLGAEVLKCQE